ncbi:MAG: hypothetical protein AAFP76_02350 [Bacteroidota bacterium]
MNKELAKFLNIVSIPVNAIFTFINFSEFYIVAIKKDIAEYPFGGSGPTPYYYKTPELYSLVIGSYATIFLLLFLLGVWNLKSRKIHGHLMLMLSLGLIFVQIFHGLSD